ncbi:hypothetical protein GCM10028805_57130 [Spirosoma harenae]
MRLPCLVKPPKSQKKNFVQEAMISWVDITPTLLDFAGVKGVARQGRSFKEITEKEAVSGWDEVYASHSLHEITMYYPMRVLRERRYKLIYNVANGVPFPMALDLYNSYTWQDIRKTAAKNYGKRSVSAFLNRPQFELYDLQTDPDEVHNLAANPKYQTTLKRMQEKLKLFQKQTHDPWVSKWEFD